MRSRNGSRTTKRRGARAAASLAWAAMLAGCTALQPSSQEQPSLHLLQPATASRSVARADLVLEVAVPRASPGYDTARIAYVDRPYAIEYYARSEWADAPARMLAPLLARALEASGGFRAVVRTSTSVQADLRVDAELVRLHQDFTSKPSHADVALRVQVVDAKARRVVATLVVEEREPAPSEDASGGVAAMNAALGRALDRTVAFVAEASRGSRPPGS